MAEFVGQNNHRINDTVAGDHLPGLSVAEFQAEFKQLYNSEYSVLIANLQSAVYELEYQMNSVFSIKSYDDFTADSQKSPKHIKRLIKDAVYHLAMSRIITLDISTLDTKDAKDRYDNLLSKQNTHEVQARKCVSMLLDKQVIGVAVV